jgi:hypothetical protein
MKPLLYIALFVLCISGAFAQDTIVVQIAHGSKPLRQYTDEVKTIGGKKGGHVVIQIDDAVYGFYFTGHRIHTFPHRKTKNGTFQKQTLGEWAAITKDKKVTKIYIPLTRDEKQNLINFYRSNLVKPSYDYSFFGQRCASSVYGLLKSIHKIKGGGGFCNAFYPAQLRKKILKQSKQRGYVVVVKQGSKKRSWEGN